MSHCYVNQLIHIMWSTGHQQYSIPPPLKNDLHAYITALVKSKNGKVLATGGSSDHIHLLMLLPQDISLASLVGHVKAYSSKWIKSRESIVSNFCWQTGYLAISTQEDKMDNVCAYIRSDNDQHRSKSYSEELLGLLKQQNIDYNETYFQQNSFAKIYVHAIWSTYNRKPYLHDNVRQHLYRKMQDVVTNGRGVVHAIGGIEDHVHLLLEMPKDKALSDLVREVKTASTHWLKDVDLTTYRDFSWQIGYGAFSVSLTYVDFVKQYILKQKEHHSKSSFQEEWTALALKRGVLYPSMIH